MSMTETYANRGRSSSRRLARLTDAAIKFANARHLARKLFVAQIHRQQAEFLRIAELPFEIVQQRPVEKSTHVHAVVNRGMQFQQMRGQIANAEILVA